MLPVQGIGIMSLRKTVVVALLALTVPAISQGGTKVINNVNLVTMRDCEVLEGRSIVISDGQIQKMDEANEIRIPDGAELIDGTGRYLMPGLSEMHAHLPSGTGSSGLNLKDTLFLYLANGVTTVRNMIGTGEHLEVRQLVKDGEILGPRIITAGPPLDSGFGYNTVGSTGDAREQVQAQAAEGYDLLKILEGLSSEEMRAISEAATRTGIEFSGHVPEEISVEDAINLGYGTIEHLDGYMAAIADPEAEIDGPTGLFGFRLAAATETERIRQVAEAVAESETWNVPTESLAYNLFEAPIDELQDSRPELRYVPEAMRNAWANQVKNMRQNMMDDPEEEGLEYMRVRKALLEGLRKRGARFLLGSDAPQWFNVPGFSIHHEISQLKEAGFSRCSILDMGTRNMAEYLDLEGATGRIEEGYDADLVLIDGNPLESLEYLRKPAGVFVRGQWLHEETISRRLEEIAAD